MKKSYHLFLIVMSVCCNSQDSVDIAGTWVLDKIEIGGDAVDIKSDTIKFTSNTFEEDVIYINESGDEFPLKQHGLYYINNSEMTWKDRKASIGEPDKVYPEIKMQFEIKGDSLILIEDAKVLRGHGEIKAVQKRYFHRLRE